MRVAEKAGTHSDMPPEQSTYEDEHGAGTSNNKRQAREQQKHRKRRGMGTLGAENAPAETESAGFVFGGATTTFEERTVWNFTVVSSKNTRAPALYFLSVN